MQRVRRLVPLLVIKARQVERCVIPSVWPPHPSDESVVTSSDVTTVAVYYRPVVHDIDEWFDMSQPLCATYDGQTQISFILPPAHLTSVQLYEQLNT